MDEPIFILSAEMDSDSFAWLDALRRQHFPPERNVLNAHLTMFHRLSQAQVERLMQIDRPATPLALHFDAPIPLGFGTAIRVRSPQLEALRAQIRQVIADDLSRQDAQRWSPHVTIQNKVAAERAKALLQSLQDGFAGRTGTATGLLLWEYLGGPWRLAQRLPFPC